MNNPAIEPIDDKVAEFTDELTDEALDRQGPMFTCRTGIVPVCCSCGEPAD